MAYEEFTRNELIEMLQKALYKAAQWDKLGEEIAEFYNEDGEEEEDEGGLCLIGEIAAEAFGFL